MVRISEAMPCHAMPSVSAFLRVQTSLQPDLLSKSSLSKALGNGGRWRQLLMQDGVPKVGHHCQARMAPDEQSDELFYEAWARLEGQDNAQRRYT